MNCSSGAASTWSVALWYGCSEYDLEYRIRGNSESRNISIVPATIAQQILPSAPIRRCRLGAMLNTTVPVPGSRRESNAVYPGVRIHWYRKPCASQHNANNVYKTITLDARSRHSRWTPRMPQTLLPNGDRGVQVSVQSKNTGRHGGYWHHTLASISPGRVRRYMTLDQLTVHHRVYRAPFYPHLVSLIQRALMLVMQVCRPGGIHGCLTRISRCTYRPVSSTGREWRPRALQPVHRHRLRLTEASC